MSADLEATYRRALRWYPKRWRVQNEDAALGTLLDQAEDEKRTSPSRGELAHLRASALGARFGVLDRVLPQWARERAALPLFGLGTAISVAGVYFGGLTWYAAHRVWSVPALVHSLGSGQGVYLFWIAAFMLAIFGLRRSAAMVLLSSVPASVGWPLIAIALGNFDHPGSVTLGFLDVLAVACASGVAFARPGHRAKLAGWAVTFGALLAAGVGVPWGGYLGGYWVYAADNVDYFWRPLAGWLVFLALPLALITAFVLSQTRQRSAVHPLILASCPLLILGLFAFGWRGIIPPVAGLFALVVVAIGLVIGIMRVFGLRITITRA